AVAAAELGDTVKLLQAGGMPVREPADRSPSAVVRQARAAGVPVVGEVPPGFDDLSPHARSAVVRVLSEGLANPARHAPGRTVWLDGDVVGGVATLSLRNASGDGGTSLTGSSGHGLRSLRHRLALLD